MLCKKNPERLMVCFGGMDLEVFRSQSRWFELCQSYVSYVFEVWQALKRAGPNHTQRT